MHMQWFEMLQCWYLDGTFCSSRYISIILPVRLSAINIGNIFHKWLGQFRSFFVSRFYFWWEGMIVHFILVLKRSGGFSGWGGLDTQSQYCYYFNLPFNFSEIWKQYFLLLLQGDATGWKPKFQNRPLFLGGGQ